MLGQQGVAVSLKIAGRHNVRNALAAAACTHAIGVPAAAIAHGLAAFRPARGRLERYQLPNGVAVIDDSYNANPDSVRAAVDVLADFPEPRALVLGDMGEVGNQGDAFHREVGTYAAQQGVTHLLSLGEATRATTVAFNAARLDPAVQYAEHFSGVAELLERAKMLPHLVLVKGSRFMKMERIVTGLGIERNAPSQAHGASH
jgi:UDP-N-acetylmuramyl pentapeptide synthase